MAHPSLVPRSARLLFAVLALLTPAASAAPITVVETVPPLWTTTPPGPGNSPTDFVGNPPDFADTSQNLHGHEPGPHTYNPSTHIIHMANVRFEPFVKQVYLKLVFAGSPTIPDPQQVGDTFDPAHWPTITPAAQPGDQPPIVVAAGVSSGLTLVITMQFLLNPQPAFEEINLTPLLQGRNVQPSNILVQTACIPSPAGSGLLAAVGVCLLSRRRRS